MTQRNPVPALISLDADQRVRLGEWAQSKTLRPRLRERARIVLAAAEGASYRAIAADLGISRDRVALWCARFRDGGIDCLAKERPRIRSRKPDAAEIAGIVEPTAKARPAGATQWGERTLATLANDEQFAHKLEAVVGVYLSPPEHTLVLCCCGMPQSQSAQHKPLSKAGGRAGRSHDISPLLAGLRTLGDNIVEDPERTHRQHVEWMGFLRWIDRLVPQDKVLHLICDNQNTCKRPNVRAWFKKHPRFHVHFTPGSTSWLNTIDRFFRGIARDGLSRGVSQSADDLVTSIPGYIVDNRVKPKPFVWTATSDVMAKKEAGEKRRDRTQT